MDCACGHGRRQHSFEGCTDGKYVKGEWVPCTCKRKYMDLGGK
jgi:hypothetical protein